MSCLEEMRHCITPDQYHPYGQVWWGGFSMVGTGRLARIEGKMNAAMYADIPDRNLLQSVQDLKLGQRLNFQKDNDPKHRAKTTTDWLYGKSVNFLEWPNLSPDLNPIEHLYRDLKMAVHCCVKSNLMEFERSCKEEWAKLTKATVGVPSLWNHIQKHLRL